MPETAKQGWVANRPIGLVGVTETECFLISHKGNKTDENEFVDRQNRPVAITGHKHTKYFKWGTTWIVPTDSSKDRDIDGALCSSLVNKDPIVKPPIVECLDNYEDSQNCGMLNSSSGSWASCVEVGSLL